jgi:lycopene cyclase domain-containing protein
MSYAALAGLFLLAPVAVCILAVARCRPSRRWWRTTAVTIVVFDTLMIAADLFRFEEADLLGIRIGLAPLEDLAWPVAAGLLLPSLWLLLTPPEER